jgi:hypothetical protein
MATEAARLKRKKTLIRKRKTDLTRTGLLMEGLRAMAVALVQATALSLYKKARLLARANQAALY